MPRSTFFITNLLNFFYSSEVISGILWLYRNKKIPVITALYKIFVVFFLYGFGLVHAVVINEIGWMGTDHSAYDEWIELYNPTQSEVDLNGWQLISSDGTPQIYLNGIIKPDDFFVLERTDDTTLSIQANQIYTGSINNDHEEIFLVHENGEIIDRTPTEPWLGGSNVYPKKSLERINAFTISGKNIANWSTAEVEFPSVFDASDKQVLGTPGAYNSVSPPKPRPVIDFVPQYFLLTVLKVSPATLGNTKEWFSLLVESDQAVDLTNWSIRRGSSVKHFSALNNSFHWNPDHFPHGNVSGQTLDYIQYPADRLIILPQKNSDHPSHHYQGIIYISPSPFALPDNGGTIEILNEKHQIIHSFTYPKTKKGSRSGQKYAEIWHQDPAGEIFPLVAWEHADINNWQKNTGLNRPTLPENVGIAISEVSLNHHENDFIELYVTQSPPNGANIRDLQITQNGTEILRITQDFWVNSGDFILIGFGKSIKEPWYQENDKTVHFFTATGKKSLAHSNGTLAVRLWTGSSWEGIEDFWCWLQPNQSMSKALLARINRSGFDQNTCFWLDEKPITSLSWAKNFLNPLTPSQSSHTFIQKQYLGSPGQMNYWPNPINVGPQAHIQIQSITNSLINVTGSHSYDYNGDFDRLSFEWILHQKNSTETHKKTLSWKQNPAVFDLEFVTQLNQQSCESTELVLELQVTDYHQIMGKKKLKLPLHWIHDICSLKPPKIKKMFPKFKKLLPDQKIKAENEDFFEAVKPLIDTYYHNSDFDFQTQKSGDHMNVQKQSLPMKQLLTKRDIFFATYPQITPNLLKKNIGWAVYAR